MGISTKKTMDEFPELATSRPIFWKSKADIEGKWDIVTKRINAVGPPMRNRCDWKKTWADMKCRTKLKISENSKEMRGTGGGPSIYNDLTDLKKDVDRICRLSSAAGPSGMPFGKKSNNPNVLEVTPPRRSTNVAVVTPTSSQKLSSQVVSLLSPTLPSSDLPATTQATSTHITDIPKLTNTLSRKRKLTENNAENSKEVKLLKLQVEQIIALVEEMKAQTKSLASMADSLRGIQQVMNNILIVLNDD